jgi:hypothetical protein
MRKHLIAPIPQSAPALNEGWLDLDGGNRGRGHIGREEISGRVCAGTGRNAGLACCRFWHSNRPANLR